MIDLEASTLKKVRNRLIPFVGLLYFAAFIDRVNVSFAAAQMNRDLGFSAYVYGLGAAAAGAIALINALGNTGGFFGPFMIGWIKDATGSFTWGLYAAAAGVLLTGIFALLIGHDPSAEHGDYRKSANKPLGRAA
jgi:hypothetical protein